MRKFIVFVLSSLLVFACKTSKDSGVNTSKTSENQASQGSETQKDGKYGELSKELRDASKDFVEKSPEESELKDLAENIANQDDKELAEKMASPEFEKILNESEKQTGGDSEKNHTISYVGLGVASLGPVLLIGGCMGYRNSKSQMRIAKRFKGSEGYVQGQKKVKTASKVAMAAGGAAIVVGGVLVAVNETMQLADDSSSARAQYIQALNRIGKELTELRESHNLHLAGSLNPCQPNTPKKKTDDFRML